MQTRREVSERRQKPHGGLHELSTCACGFERSYRLNVAPSSLFFILFSMVNSALYGLYDSSPFCCTPDVILHLFCTCTFYFAFPHLMQICNYCLFYLFYFIGQSVSVGTPFFYFVEVMLFHAWIGSRN